MKRHIILYTCLSLVIGFVVTLYNVQKPSTGSLTPSLQSALTQAAHLDGTAQLDAVKQIEETYHIDLEIIKDKQLVYTTVKETPSLTTTSAPNLTAVKYRVDQTPYTFWYTDLNQTTLSNQSLYVTYLVIVLLLLAFFIIEYLTYKRLVVPQQKFMKYYAKLSNYDFEYTEETFTKKEDQPLEALRLFTIDLANKVDEIQSEYTNKQLTNQVYQSEIEDNKILLSAFVHDLKAPLQGTKITISQIENKLTDDIYTKNKLAYMSEIIDQTLIKINEINKNILQPSRISLTPEWIDIETVLMEELFPYKPNILEKEIELNIQCGNLLRFYFNKNVFLQIIKNAFANAFQYTHFQGQVNIDIKKESKHITLQLFNTATFLTEDQLKNAFQLFRRETTSNTTGSGIGLTIIKSLTDRYQGKCTLENDYIKGGIILTIVLPQADTGL